MKSKAAKSRAETDTQTADEKEVQRTSHWLFSRRGPLFLDPIFRIGDQSIGRIGPYLDKDQVAVDLGCGWGHYAFALAEIVGSSGKVYAVDLASKCIHRIKSRSARKGIKNIEAYTASASSLPFIEDRSVDLVFANGLLCSMAKDRPSAIDEIQRILKPSGHAYLSLGATPPYGYVDQIEWENILGRFTVDEGGPYEKQWAIVSSK
jgi:ubiquinone/menaquinone biosynthesis C-methylase UbiE